MFFQVVSTGMNKFIGAALVLVGLFLFTQSATAQSGLTPATAQAGMTFKTSNGAQIDFSNLVDAGTALTILQGQYESYEQSTPSNAKEEAIRNIAMEYTLAVAHTIVAGTPVHEALTANMGVVDATNSRFQANLRVNPADVVQQAAQALSN